MKAVLVNYNFTPDWLLTSDLDYLLYDRSDSKDYLKDFPQDRIIYTENLGQVDYDKLSYLIENYHTLPEVFLWGKSNLFKYITEAEWEKVKDNQVFTPLLKQDHRLRLDENGVIVNYYQGGMYHEWNNSWYVSQFSHRYFGSYPEFAHEFSLPSPAYLPFAPGGNYILTREVVHKYAQDFYIKMRDLLPYCREPAEAQMCERSYFNLWK